MTALAASGLRRYLAPGEHVVSADPDTVLSTILGSCVAVCLWDGGRGVGGMNHILLPDAGERAHSGIHRFAAAAMEILINEMAKAGAARSAIRAKVFGGASMLGAAFDIGACNVAFARGFLDREGIPCDAVSTGGSNARQIRFWPHSGRAMQRLVRTPPPKVPPRRVAVESGVELFQPMAAS
jgi:chemotaxis protein CheD